MHANHKSYAFTMKSLLPIVLTLLLALTATTSSAYKVESAVVDRPTTLSKQQNVLERTSSRGGATTARKFARPNSSEGATIPSEVFNLVKGIVGVGVLGLPAGVAAFGNAPSAAIPASILIAIIGILSGYGFAVIGRVCGFTGATSYREAWSRSVGEDTSWIPAWSATIKTFLACTAFSMVLADTFSALFQSSRNPTLMVVTGAILLPLCLLKNLKALAPFSLMGVMGMLYTAIAMTVRYMDGSYVAPGGEFITGMAAKYVPKFGSKGMDSVYGPEALILVSMLATAYIAHFNAPKFYTELKNNTMPRWNQVVAWSFGISIVLMGAMTCLGFLTFGGACSGLVLNNYSTKDVWMSGSRIAVAVSLVFSYPLAFVGCRDGILDLLQVKPRERTPLKVNSLTIGLLSLLTVIACVLKDLGFVMAFGGATLGNALTYVYPALMYRAIVKKQNRQGENIGVTLSLASAVLGVVMGAVGAKMALATL